MDQKEKRSYCTSKKRNSKKKDEHTSYLLDIEKEKVHQGK